MFVLGLDYSKYSDLIINTTIFFVIIIAPLFAYIGTFTTPTRLIRRGKLQKNSKSLFFLEWMIWSIPIFILSLFILITFSNFSSESTLKELIVIRGNVVRYNDLLIRLFMGYIFFVLLIIGPMCANIGVLTRPLLKKQIEKRNMEEEKMEIIELIDKTSGSIPSIKVTESKKQVTSDIFSNIKKIVFCSECGSKNEEDARFCYECGKKMN